MAKSNISCYSTSFDISQSQSTDSSVLLILSSKIEALSSSTLSVSSITGSETTSSKDSVFSDSSRKICLSEDVGESSSKRQRPESVPSEEPWVNVFARLEEEKEEKTEASRQEDSNSSEDSESSDILDFFGKSPSTCYYDEPLEDPYFAEVYAFDVEEGYPSPPSPADKDRKLRRFI